MKRTLLMIAAVALLLTQCRKPAVELPTAGPANENMVSMTVTVGHGRTLIGADGTIKWSENDKLYVGDGSKYIGCLTLQSGADSPTGTFTGSVSTTSSTTFGFYYLGRNTPAELTAGSTSVDISFAEQDGRIGNLSDCHIGYGTATGKVDGASVVLDGTDPVTMTSKVAIAYFEFKKDDGNGYEGGVRLSGANICNSMTVGFNGSFSGTTGTAGKAISLRNTSSSKKYVMLVPPATVGEETLEFGGGAEGSTKFYKGIEANKFYCLGAGKPIEVTVTPTSTPTFTVGKDGYGNPITVEFSPGNLYWDGTDSKWKFEANQWDFTVGKWNESTGSYNLDDSHVSHFYWSKSAEVAVAEDYEDDEASTEDSFFTNTDETTANPNFHVSGDAGENQWRTLSRDEWEYLLYDRDDAESLRAWKALDSGVHKGLVLLPAGTEDPEGVLGGLESTADLASYGAVFLPAGGSRNLDGIVEVGEEVAFWSSTAGSVSFSYSYAYGFDKYFEDEIQMPAMGSSNRCWAYLVRLVR